MNEVKAKRKVIEEQAKDAMAANDAITITSDNIETVCEEIKEDLISITEEKKRKYMQNLIKSIYVKERRSALVNGYIPLTTQAQNIQDESICRDRQDTIPSLAFRFSFLMPLPNKARIITQRDKLGRILHSKPTQVQI